MTPARREQIHDALKFAVMQFLSWSICTLSWRAVAQANYAAAVLTDTTLGTLNFFVLRKIAKAEDATLLIPWIGYTLGGVAGTLTGIWLSLHFLGK